MKKMLIFAAAAALLAACQKPEDEQTGLDGNKFTVSLESPTKVHLSQGEKAVWSASDAFSVFNHNDGNSMWMLDSGIGTQEGTITCKEAVQGGATDKTVALYPYDPGATLSNGIINTRISAHQVLAEGSYDPVANLMAATENAGKLRFNNLLGYIKIMLDKPAAVIEFKGNGGEIIAGNATVDPAAATVQLSANGQTTITIDCSAASSGTYYIPVAPVLFANGFTASVKYADGQSEDKVVRNVVDIARNEIFSIDEGSFVTDAFIFELTKITHDSVYGSVTPMDDQMLWILFLDDKETVDAFGSDEALLADDYRYFQTLAQYYECNISDIIADMAMTGPFEGLISDGLEAESEYTAYIYGISLDGKPLTEVTRINFTTSAFGQSDATFEIETAVEGNSINVSVTPSDDDVIYYFDILTKEELDNRYEGDIEAAAQDVIDYTIDFYGMDPEDFVYDLASIGPDEYEFTNLEPDTEYLIFACAINPYTAGVNSEVASIVVKTDAVEQSDNVIAIDIAEVTGTSVLMSTSTTNDDPYMLVVEPAYLYEGLSDDELARAIIRYYGDYVEGYLYEGDQEELEHNGLIPGTEYYVVAFGYSSGGASTDIVKQSVTTISAGDPHECSFQFSVTGITSDRATLTVVPSDQLAGFDYGIVPEGTSAAQIKAEAEAVVEEGCDFYGVDALLMWQLMAKRGDETRKYTGLEAGTSYVPYAVVIDEHEGGFASEVIFGEPFSTLAEGEIPEGEVSLFIDLDLPSRMFDLTPEEVAEYPDYSCLAYAIEGEYIASGTYAFRKTSEIEDYTEEQINSMMFFANKLSDKKLSYIESEGYYTDIFVQLDPETSYTFIVEAKDAKGNTVRKMATATTAAAPAEASARKTSLSRFLSDGKNVGSVAQKSAKAAAAAPQTAKGLKVTNAGKPVVAPKALRTGIATKKN